jgi:hypothetical protein
MECSSTLPKVSTRQVGKRIGKPNAKARRNSRRLIEYNQKKAISAIRNSLAARMQSSIKRLMESHKSAFQTRQQYYRSIIYGLHLRLKEKDKMIAKLGVSCHHLYERVHKREFTDGFLRHLAAKYDWLKHYTMDEVRAKIDINSESFAAERRAYPRRIRPKQRVTAVCTDALPLLPGEVESWVDLHKMKYAQTTRGEQAAKKVSARPQWRVYKKGPGESSSTQTKTVPIPPAKPTDLEIFRAILAAKRAQLQTRK